MPRFQLGLYGRHSFGAVYLAAALSYGWQDVATDRTVTVAGTDQLRGRFNAQTFGARGELGYRYATPVFGLTPYGALQLTNIRTPGYAENAVIGSNQFALAYASNSFTNLRSEIGLRADKSFLMADGLFTVRGRTAWAHDSNTNRSITPNVQALPGSSSFTINGAQPSANGALLTAGAEMKWHNGWAVAATYEGEFSHTTASNAGKGQPPLYLVINTTRWLEMRLWTSQACCRAHGPRFALGLLAEREKPDSNFLQSVRQKRGGV